MGRTCGSHRLSRSCGNVGSKRKTRSTRRKQTKNATPGRENHNRAPKQRSRSLLSHRPRHSCLPHRTLCRPQQPTLRTDTLEKVFEQSNSYREKFGSFPATRGYLLPYPTTVQATPSPSRSLLPSVLEKARNGISAQYGLTVPEFKEAAALWITPMEYRQAKDRGFSPQHYAVFNANGLTLDHCETPEISISKNLEEFVLLLTDQTTEDV